MTTKAAALAIMIQGTGRGGTFLTTSAGNVGGTTLVSTDFKSAAALPADYFDRAWFNVPSATAPRQARATTSALTIATGTITLDVALGSQIGSGVTVRWSPLMPIVAAAATGGGPSFEDALYEVLRHLLFSDEITQAITTTNDIPLTGTANFANVLDRSGRLVQVLEPNPFAGGGELVDSSFRDPKLILDGETPKLRFGIPFSSATGNLTLRVLRPADSWLEISSTWQEAAPGVGLAAETDKCKPDLRHIREGGLVFVYQALAQSRTGPRRAEYQALYEQQLGIARALPFWDASRDSLLPRPGQSDAAQEAA